MEQESDLMKLMARLEDQIWADFGSVFTQHDLRAALDKWRNPSTGILARVKTDSYYLQAPDYEQEMFQDYFAERLRMKEQYFYERRAQSAN